MYWFIWFMKRIKLFLFLWYFRRKLYWDKNQLNFIFTLFCDASKGFMKALFSHFFVMPQKFEPFEAPQRSVKINVEVNLLSSSGVEVGKG